jgi:hypothetical protein
MRKNFKYRNKPCGYCGKNTGDKGEGDHVIPNTLYPSTTAPKVQRIKIPCCPACNDSWQKDESHFRTVIDMLGNRMTPERAEIWEAARRCFQIPEHGEIARKAVAELLVPHDKTGDDKESDYKMFPLRDPKFVRVMCKIIRGLSYYETDEILLNDDRVFLVNAEIEEPPAEGDDTVRVVCEVPHVFKAWCFTSEVCEGPTTIHSIWTFKFYDSSLFAAFVLREDENQKPGIAERRRNARPKK